MCEISGGMNEVYRLNLPVCHTIYHVLRVRSVFNFVDQYKLIMFEQVCEKIVKFIDPDTLYP